MIDGYQKLFKSLTENPKDNDYQKKISSLKAKEKKYTMSYLKSTVMAKKTKKDRGWELTTLNEKLSDCQYDADRYRRKAKRQHTKLLKAQKSKSKTTAKPSVSDINKIKSYYDELNRLHKVFSDRMLELSFFAEEKGIPFYD